MEIQAFCAKSELNYSTQLIRDAASRRGIKFELLARYQHHVAHELFRLSDAEQSHIMDITRPDVTSATAFSITKNKYVAQLFLQQHDMPHTFAQCFRDPRLALQAFRERQERVTVKPVVGKHGLGVSMAVDSEPLFLNAVASAMQHHAAFMVERFFDAPDYRLLFINHQCIAVSQRLPAFVDGDGVHDVLELIAIANADRAEDRKGPLSKIKIDEEVKKHLNRHGMGLGSVPAKDQRVFLRTQTSMDLGGVGVNLDVSLHAEVAAKLGQLTKLLGLQVAEIDVVSSDISSTFNKGQHAILEISSRPRIRLQECPYAGKPVAASDAILDMLFGAS